ncbi:MAG: HAD family hydrolase [Candidatus Aegiribacteria sp.]|nr:HAD family hydrolase [Candidatus Aegiribacteria sp.]
MREFFGEIEPALSEQNLTVFEKRIRSLCTSLEIKASDKDIASIADLIAGKWQESIELDQDAVPVLKELLQEGRILGLVSNFDHPRHVRKYLSIYGLDCLFKTIIISGEVGVKKPHPDIFNPALAATGLFPDEVVYVGDADVDVDAANAAGIIPVLIKRQGADKNNLDFDNDSPNAGISDISQTGRQCETISSLGEILSLLKINISDGKFDRGAHNSRETVK